MDSNLPQTNPPNNNPMIQNQSIWISNPHLKMLLLILIFVFLGCGIGLAVFSQWSSQYRQQIYDQTQAGLPVHVDKPIATSTEASSLIETSNVSTTTPIDITSWKTYKNDQYGFVVKYPENWNDSEHSYGLDVFQIKTANLRYNFFIQSINETNPSKEPDCFKELKQERFNSLDWSINEEICGEGGTTAISAILYKDNLVFRILLESQSDYSIAIEQLNQILSTFKFTK